MGGALPQDDHCRARNAGFPRGGVYLGVMIKSLTLAALLTGALASTALAAEELSLSAISDYLNGFSTAESDFVQYNEDGSKSTGTLYVKRPGKMRFEYNPPNKGYVIASAGSVMVRDSKSNVPPETYPLKRTPLSIILEKKVDLGRANMVVGHDFDGTYTVVRAQDPEHPEYGFIDLKFSDAPVALRQWTITNEQGSRTAVVLDGLETGMTIQDSLFYPDITRRANNR